MTSMMGRRENCVAELTAILSVSTSLPAIVNTVDIVGRSYPLLCAIQTESTRAMRALRRGTWSVLPLRRQAGLSFYFM